jgi:FkbM family methyltransferase
MNTLTDPSASYWLYLQQRCPQLSADHRSRLAAEVEGTAWDEPTTALDFNNVAVMLLIEAEQCQDSTLRSMQMEMAIAALTQGAAREVHPLCTAHLALIHYMTGELEAASRTAFSQFVGTLQFAHMSVARQPLGLIYLPSDKDNWSAIRADELQHLLQAEDGFAQAHLLLTLTLCRSQLVFYNANGLRFLQFAALQAPNSFAIHFKLGISKLMNQQWEGIWHLQQARTLAPDFAPILQALHLVYRQEPQISQFWRKIAQNYYQQSPELLASRWTELPEDSPFTYLTFEDAVLLAVEPSFHSMVTSVLLAEADWFEAEMQFWRDRIQPGMTVIDVGANVGIYTFSAARRVGEAGRVLAVEPFSACVQYLQETCRVNQFSWVKVCAGAASDRNGKARLSLHASNELNEVITNDAELEKSDQSEEIDCFTLDCLIEQEQLSRIDWLKIDAESHEIQVLTGSDRLLSEFAPNILYENVAGTKGSNPEIAEFLQAKGYQLFRYQPYLKELISVQSIEDLQESLNIIALPIRQ